MARTLLLALTALFFALAAAPLAPAQSYDVFRREFDQAAKLGAKAKMDELMRKQEDQAIYTVLITAEAISNAPNDVLYTRFDALRSSWSRVYESKFPDEMEIFFANLSSKGKVERRKLKDRFDKVAKQQAAAQKEKDLSGLILVATEMEGLAGVFKQIDDKWYESQASLAAAVACEETYHKKKADLNRVANNYARAVALRVEIGVKDRAYKEMVPRLQILNGLGFGSGAKGGGGAGGGDGPGAGPSAASAGSAVVAKLEFQPFKDTKDDMRPSYYLDMHWQVWPSVSLTTVGSSVTIPRVKDGPTIFRQGSDKIMVDIDGDGTGESDADLRWPTRGKLELITLELGSGASKRKWGVFTQVGRQDDFYQGQQMNLMATDSSYQLYYSPGGSMVGEISGVPIELIDDDLDGVYGSPALAYAHLGLRKGTNQLDLDSIRVDGESRARPYSEFVNLGKAGWHKLESRNGGTELAAEPYTFKTGTLQLKGKGIKPDFFVVKGTGDVLSSTYIDIAGGKKVEVPVGRYELAFGLVRKGKKMQLVKAVIRGSEQTPAYDVSEGEDAVVTFGAPYGFDFLYDVGADTVTVDGSSVVITGAGGEVYDRFYNTVPYPEASVRKEGARKGGGKVKMRPGVSLDDISKHGWAGMWKPLKVDVQKKGDKVQVQLTEKKNRLFGKIVSAWK